jgi:DNA-binding response OmpR family regulator
MDECCCHVGLAIVEDEKSLVSLLLNFFKIRHIAVCFIAYDGRDALLNFIHCNPQPHIILMDYRLPSMDGIEVTKEILNISPTTKVIFLSADEGVKDRALKAGAIAFLQKPTSLKDIALAIEEVVERFPGIKIYST